MAATPRDRPSRRQPVAPPSVPLRHRRHRRRSGDAFSVLGQVFGCYQQRQAGLIFDADADEDALHPLDLAVEQIDQRPLQRLKVGLQAALADDRFKGMEHRGEFARRLVRIGQRPGIGLVGRALAVHGEVLERAGGG
jgi:hypothetical protein